MKKLNIEQLIALLEDNREKICNDMLLEYKEHFKTLPGSLVKHQAWEGGLLDHIVEVMNIANILYQTMNEKRKLPFSLSDALFVIFFHDFDKLERYSFKNGKLEAEKYQGSADNIKEFLEKKWSYKLSDVEYNTFKYAHGEGDDYSSKKVMNELTAFVHVCDTISARIWFDYGKDKEEWA